MSDDTRRDAPDGAVFGRAATRPRFADDALDDADDADDDDPDPRPALDRDPTEPMPAVTIEPEAAAAGADREPEAAETEPPVTERRPWATGVETESETEPA